MTQRRLAVGLAICVLWSVAAQARMVLRVGPAEKFRTIAAAAQAARDGDVVEILAGTYRGDVAVWTRDRLTIRSVGGPARLIAEGASAEGKAIWVIRGGRVIIENIEFSGTRVADGNGAGIRFEKGRLTIRHCVFTDNENGLMAGNDPEAELNIEDSEFGHNGAGDGYTHNLYVGRIHRLSVIGSYFHHARVGHLLKSRAAESFIAYSRLTDEEGGSASYELEFPNGGEVHVVGNIVQQGRDTQNPTLISFGAEGLSWKRNTIVLSGNTLIDDRAPPGFFLRVKEGTSDVVAYNNVLVGGRADQPFFPSDKGNIQVRRDRIDDEFRLVVRGEKSPAAVVVDRRQDLSVVPDREYVHPMSTRKLRGQPGLPGAMQSTVP